MTDAVQTYLTTMQAAKDQAAFRAAAVLLAEVIQPDPAAALELLGHLLAGDPAGSWGNDGLVNFLDEADLPAVFQAALPALLLDYDAAQQAGLLAAHQTLEQLTRCAPALFYPHLSDLWRENRDNFQEAWQDSGTRHHAELVTFLETLPPARSERPWDAYEGEEQEQARLRHRDRRAALSRLQRSNCSEGFQLARQYGEPQDTVYQVVDDCWTKVPNTEGRYLLEEAGSVWRAGAWHRLFPEASYHLRFPEALRRAETAETPWLFGHPTWQLPGDAGPLRFGGAGQAGCPICGEASHHLFTLEQAPPGIEVATPLVIETCLYCAMHERPMYARHDAAGRPELFPSYHTTPRDFEMEPLPEMAVTLAPTPARFYRQPWEGNISRIGGVPTWIQGPEWETCPECGQLMLFLAQIGDGLVYINGVLYVSWCGACHVSAVLNTYT